MEEASEALGRALRTNKTLKFLSLKSDAALLATQHTSPRCPAVLAITLASTHRHPRDTYMCTHRHVLPPHISPPSPAAAPECMIGNEACKLLIQNLNENAGLQELNLDCASSHPMPLSMPHPAFTPPGEVNPNQPNVPHTRPTHPRPSQMPGSTMTGSLS